MSIQKYLEGCKRGVFTWECQESGTYGEGNAVDIEFVSYKGRVCRIFRNSSKDFHAEFDGYNNPTYDEKDFTSRLSARKWCERMILKDITKGGGII